MEEKDFYKQTDLYDPSKHDPKAYVYGAGSIGSHVTMALAKIGVQDITLYDFDTIEPSNVPSQFFPVGLKENVKKINAMKKLTRMMTGTTINIVDAKIDETFNPVCLDNSIHIIAFDNIESRKVLAEKLDGNNVWLIDGRIGGYNYEIYTAKCDNKEHMKSYYSTLEGEFSHLPCSAKCLWVTNTQIATTITSMLVKLEKEMMIPEFIKGNIMSSKIIERVRT